MVGHPFRHAIVAGGGIAGLLAARVLADHFQKVTLIERDTLAPAPIPRKGAPQGRHLHILLAGGMLALERLFPGLRQELVASGAVVISGGREFAYYYAREWRVSNDRDLVMLSMTRPLLECRIAERVRALTNVVLREKTRVDGFLSDNSPRVTGVRIRPTGQSTVGEEVTADLVVDAMGRGSATPQWLAQLGLDPPEVELIRAPVRYATSAFARPNCWSAWRGLVVGGAPLRRGGAVLPIEGGRWLVSLTGYFNERMPTNHREFLEFSRSLPVPDLYEAIRDREILSEVVHHGFPGSQRRRYERLERFPERLIVLGDAACSFNPVYGQGMTVSALEAEQLDKMLARAKAEGTIGPGFARQWFRSATALIDAAWDGVLIEDFRFPELANERPLRLRLLQWYMGRVHRATYRSTRVTDQFYRVLNFMDPPATLFRPRIALDVLFGRPKIADTQPSGVEAPSGARPNSAKVG